MPNAQKSSYTEIVINYEVYGVVLRTKTNIKPIFVSVGNNINIAKCIDIVINLIGKESRISIPTRLSYIEVNKLKRKLGGQL